jgi:hypothetical protein
MKRIISALALAGALSLGACATPTTTPESVIAGDAQALLTAAEANGSISPSAALTVQDVITGFQDVSTVTETSIAAGDSSALTALKSLNASIGQLAADTANPVALKDAKQAQQLLTQILSSTSGGTVTLADAEKAAASFLIDYLAASSPVGAAPGTISPTGALISNARGEISKIR